MKIKKEGKKKKKAIFRQNEAEIQVEVQNYRNWLELEVEALRLKYSFGVRLYASMAASSEAEMKKEEAEGTTEQHPEQNDDESHPPLSARSSPPHSLSGTGSQRPSPPAHSLSISSDFSDHTCHSHGHSSIDDSLSITPMENLPPCNPPSPRPVAANRAQPTEPIVVTEVDAEIQGVRKVQDVSDADVESGDGGAVGRGRKLMASLSMKKMKREEMRKKILLGFRICGFAFCLVSFSVMASDKNQGWALDSFYRYKEFRLIQITSSY